MLSACSSEDSEFKQLLSDVLKDGAAHGASESDLKATAIGLAKAWRSGIEQYRKEMNCLSN